MSSESTVGPQRIGEFLVESGVLRAADIPRILEHGRETGLRFGDAAIDLGVLTPHQLKRALGSDDRTDFFAVRAEHFPQATRSWIELPRLLEWGVLPLGCKKESSFFRKRLRVNLGCIQPSETGPSAVAARDAEILAYLRGRVLEPVSAIRRYLILPDQYLKVLEVHYGWSPEAPGLAMDASVHPLLKRLLRPGE